MRGGGAEFQLPALPSRLEMHARLKTDVLTIFAQSRHKTLVSGMPSVPSFLGAKTQVGKGEAQKWNSYVLLGLP